MIMNEVIENQDSLFLSNYCELILISFKEKAFVSAKFKFYKSPGEPGL